MNEATCPKCNRALAPEPDGVLFCVDCARPTWWGNLVSVIEPTEGWREIGWLFRGLLVAVVFAFGIFAWGVAFSGWGNSWGTRAAVGGIFLFGGLEALIAISAAVFVRSLVSQLHTQLAILCAILVAVPGVFALLRVLLTT